MKAIICPAYGSPDILRLQEVAQPTPKANEVLVKIHAASVNAADWHLLRADPFLVRLMFGLFKPKVQILGSDIAGEVATVGAAVKQFQPGDLVFGDLSGVGLGAFAEYVAVLETALALKPANLSYTQAAAAPLAAITALQGLRDHGKLQPGHKVLINGASGGVGTFAVQIAKALGAEVTAVCSTTKVDLVRSLGADHVIDYTKADFARNGQQYDLILAANGNRSLADYRRALTPTGIYVMVGGTMTQLFQAMLLGPWYSLRSRQKLGNMLAQPNQQDLLFLKELLEAGKIAPVIDRSYPLAAVPDAIRYVEAGHARGKVVITVTA